MFIQRENIAFRVSGTYPAVHCACFHNRKNSELMGRRKRMPTANILIKILQLENANQSISKSFWPFYVILPVP